MKSSEASLVNPLKEKMSTMAMATVSVAAPVRARLPAPRRPSPPSWAVLPPVARRPSPTPSARCPSPPPRASRPTAASASAVSTHSAQRRCPSGRTALSGPRKGPRFFRDWNPTPCSASGTEGARAVRSRDGTAGHRWIGSNRPRARASNHHDAGVPSHPVTLRIVHPRSPRVAPPPGAPHPFLIHFTSH